MFIINNSYDVRLLIFSRNSCALAQAPECGRVVDAALHSAQSTTFSHNADHYWSSTIFSATPRSTRALYY